MPGSIRFGSIRYAAALVPAVVLLVIAVLINADRYETDRARRVADHARLAAASVDLRLGQFLELASFCASSPALLERIDLDSVAENCGRYASRIGACMSACVCAYVNIYLYFCDTSHKYK